MKRRTIGPVVPETSEVGDTFGTILVHCRMFDTVIIHCRRARRFTSYDNTNLLGIRQNIVQMIYFVLQTPIDSATFESACPQCVIRVPEYLQLLTSQVKIPLFSRSHTTYAKQHIISTKIQVGIDQEIAQSERNSLSTYRGVEK